MKKYNYAKGKNGEDAARKYLTEKGYEFVDANHENGRGEIDLIMSKDDRLIFVEVKMKTGDKWGRPEEMINKHKIYRVKSAAEGFLVLNPLLAVKFKKYRIDAVCIVTDETMKVKEIKHYENLY